MENPARRSSKATLILLESLSLTSVGFPHLSFKRSSTLQPYLCGQSASDVAKATDVCTEQWEKAARMQIESQMPNEYELKADSAK